MIIDEYHMAPRHTHTTQNVGVNRTHLRVESEKWEKSSLRSRTCLTMREKNFYNISK